MASNLIRADYGILMAAAALLSACAQRDSAVNHAANHGADIIVSGTSRHSEIARGQSAEFSYVVNNAGPRDASHVRIVDTVGKQSKLVSITCAAQGNAVCPNPVGEAMVAESLPSGASLQFLVTARLADQGTGTILNSMAASFAEDADPNNNIVTNDVLVR